MNSYIETLKKYALFTGRARRKEYWTFALVGFVISAVLALIEVASGMFQDSSQSVLASLYQLGVLLPNIGVSIRRMHDGITAGGGCWFPSSTWCSP